MGRKNKIVLAEAHMKKLPKILALVLVVVLGPWSAFSQVISWDYNRVLTGDAPSGSVSVRYSDNRFTIKADLAEGEYLSDLYFSTAWRLHYSLPERVGQFSFPSITWATYFLPRGLSFPLWVEFVPSELETERFDNQDGVTWTLASVLPLTPPSPSFRYDCGDWMWLARVQGIGPDGQGSGLIGHYVPEPGAFTGVFALGLAGLAVFRRFGRRAK